MKSTGRPGLPRLRLAPRIVDHLGRWRVSLSKSFHSGSSSPIEAGLFVAEVHPLLVLALAREQRVEIVGELPVLELGAVEQHDAGGVVRRRPPLPAHDRLALHVAAQQLPHVLDREHVRVDHDRPALVIHQLGRHEAQRGEGLQVLLVPDAAVAIAAVGAALVLREEVLIGLVLDQLDVELICVARVASHRVQRHQCAEILLMVRMDEDAWFHDR